MRPPKDLDKYVSAAEGAIFLMSLATQILNHPERQVSINVKLGHWDPSWAVKALSDAPLMVGASIVTKPARPAQRRGGRNGK